MSPAFRAPVDSLCLPFICCTSRSKSRRSPKYSNSLNKRQVGLDDRGHIWPQFSSPHENSSCWSFPNAVEFASQYMKNFRTLFYSRLNHDCRRLLVDPPFPLHSSLGSQYNSKVKPSTSYSVNSGGDIDGTGLQ